MTDRPEPSVANTDDAETWVIVVGGGSGRRFGTMKQFEALIGDERVIDRSVAVAASVANGVVIVVPPARVAPESDRWSRDRSDGATIRVVGGGDTRAASVRAGLALVPEAAAVICVHDAARPLASVELYRRVVGAILDGSDGVVPGVPVVDTIKRVDDAGWVIDTPPRDRLVAVQTPQGFRADLLRRAHADGADGSDDAVLVEGVGGRVAVIAGEAANIKITEPSDIDTVRRHLG